MRPYQHALSSVGTFGGCWRDYLPVHEFIDSTKVACSDIRHRMILHSVDFGGALTRMVFPDCGIVDEVVIQHVVEDLGEARTLSGWLEQCHAPLLPRIYPGALPIESEKIIARAMAGTGARWEQKIRQVWALLAMPMTFAPSFGANALCILCNSFGPTLSRRLLGPPIESDGSFFDPALCAERMIYGIYRAIPSVTAVVYSLSSSQKGGIET